MTPYDFVYRPGPRRNRLQWPDFWYMQIERRGLLTVLRTASKPISFSGFRPSALYTTAEQVRAHVELLHRGERNNYLPPQTTSL